MAPRTMATRLSLVALENVGLGFAAETVAAAVVENGVAGREEGVGADEVIREDVEVELGIAEEEEEEGVTRDEEEGVAEGEEEEGVGVAKDVVVSGVRDVGVGVAEGGGVVGVTEAGGVVVMGGAAAVDAGDVSPP
jgi:hypothetical protein